MKYTRTAHSVTPQPRSYAKQILTKSFVEHWKHWFHTPRLINLLVYFLTEAKMTLTHHQMLVSSGPDSCKPLQKHIHHPNRNSLWKSSSVWIRNCLFQLLSRAADSNWVRFGSSFFNYRTLLCLNFCKICHFYLTFQILLYLKTALSASVWR